MSKNNKAWMGRCYYKIMKKKIQTVLKVVVYCSFALSYATFTNANNVGYFKDSFKGLEYAIWYPSTSPVSVKKLGPFKVKYSLRGEVKKGRYPVVILSHGNGGRLLSHRRTAEHLVKNGFVVFTVAHTVDDKFNFKRPELLQKRASELNVINDAFAKHIVISKNIDRNKLYVIGYSLGGATALMSAGVGYDFNNIVRHCVDNYKNDVQFCKKKVIEIKNEVGIARVPEKLKYNKIVLVAPFGQGAISSDLQNIDTDVLLIRFGQDKILKYPFHSQYLSEKISQNRLRYLTKYDAHHFAFISPFPKYIKIEPAKDPKGFDRESFLIELNTMIVNFLNK